MRLREQYDGPHDLIHTSDGKTLFLRRWDAKEEPKASVLIFHGITAHSGPYGRIVADQLCGAGYNVFAIDLRGHGLSDGRRGDYPSEERFVKDLRETVAFTRSRSKKLVVLGHSLGALAAIVATKEDPENVDGLVLVSAARRIRTGVYPRPAAGAMAKIMLGVEIFRGSPEIEYRREGQVGFDDPLFTFRYSVRFYSILYGVGALRAMGMSRSGVIDSPNLAFDAKLGIPLFVAVGDKDELFSADAARDFCESIVCDDKEFHVIQGARHAVWPEGAFTPLVDWLGRKF